MNGILLLIAIFFIAIIITFIVLCCYIKLLAIVADKLKQALNKVSETRSDARKESSIEVCCIKCFDKTYHVLYTYMSLVGITIKKFIWNKEIGKNSYNSEKECSDKNRNRNDKSFLPAPTHNRIIKRRSTKYK